MDEKEILQAILEKLGSMDKEIKEIQLRTDQRLTALEKGQQELNIKMDKGYGEMGEAAGKILIAIDDQIKETVKAFADNIEYVETVTAQNSFDVQWLRGKALQES